MEAARGAGSVTREKRERQQPCLRPVPIVVDGPGRGTWEIVRNGARIGDSFQGEHLNGCSEDF